MNKMNRRTVLKGLGGITIGLPLLEEMAGTSAAAAKAVPVLVAALLGVFMLYGVGFAAPQTLHNAAHDTRHAFAFPCH